MNFWRFANSLLRGLAAQICLMGDFKPTRISLH